jgi:hypothetical protein
VHPLEGAGRQVVGELHDAVDLGRLPVGAADAGPVDQHVDVGPDERVPARRR